MAKSPSLEISAKGSSLRKQVNELWQYRGLGISFAKRDFQVRYAQTFLGPLWALLQPLLSLGVLYLVFQKALNANTEGVPFISYTLSGLIFWGFFNFNLSQGSASLIQARGMLQKIYFPRLLLVLSKSLVALVDLLFVLLIFLFVAFADAHFSFATLAGFLGALILSLLASQGLALWFAALSVRFRDLQQLIPFISQMLFFLSPIAYSPDLWTESIPLKYQDLLYLNPMMGILEMWRAPLFELENLTLSNLPWWGIIWCFSLFISGWIYFQKSERKMADLL
jgi:lipopolysaccharide transport system permease protein